MKKLLLGLGTISLAILPVVAMISCSTTPTPTTPTLDTESEKFNISLLAKHFTITTSDAIAAIVWDQSTNHDALKNLVGEDKLPTLADGFTYKVTTAVVNSKIPTTVDVKITVTETDGIVGSNTKYATLSITKLTSVTPSLSTESNKFTLNLDSLDPTITTSAAIATFRGDADTKLKALKDLVGEENLPILADGFTFEVKLVALNSETPTTVDVEITVIETNGTEGSNTQDAILKITNLALIPTLDSETQKMNISLDAVDLSKNTSTLVEEVNGAADESEKLSILQNLVGAENIPVLEEGFWFGVKSAAVNSTTPTTLDINITVRSGWFWFRNTILQVTNVPLPTLETEASKLAISKVTKTPTTTQANALSSITSAADATAKLAAFIVLVDVPKLSSGFEYEVKSATESGTTNLNVSITVKNTNNGVITTKDVTFTIIGFAPNPA